MSRGVSNKITYKPYSQNEQWIIPPSLDELVPENHFVRIVSKTVDELRIEKVFAKINERLAEINDLNDENSKDVKKTEKSKTTD